MEVRLYHAHALLYDCLEQGRMRQVVLQLASVDLLLSVHAHLCY